MPPAAVDLHPEALAEARAAYAWYRERNAVAAAAFMDELDAAVLAIGTDPLAWPAYLAGTRRYLLRRFPFSVVFRVREDGLQVVAVAHARRRPGYWRIRA